jgi:hypothetical protein
MTDNGGVTDWTSGRPFDSCNVGEAGWISETGITILLDSFMAMMAVDDGCGFWSFYHDQMTRMAGCNMQIWSAGREWEMLYDGAEFHEYNGSTPYPWENMGLFSPGDPTQQKDAQAVQVDEPWYAPREPKEDKQQAFHRTIDYGGYLGQGEKRIILGKPTDPPEQNEYDQELMFPNLYERNTGLSGMHFERSAKGFFFLKCPFIPAPKRKKRVEDPEGDTKENYKFGGVEGEGDEHMLAGQVAEKGPKPSLTRATAILDLQAYLYNWTGAHPFHYHMEDWYLPEASEVDYVEKEQLMFGKLAGQQYLDPPQATEIDIDERLTGVKIYPNRSYFGLLDDGGIVLGDGWGGEIRMVGGSLFLTTPGDTWIKSGKNCNIWSGFDNVFKAHNSTDISSTKKDLRLKADKNLQILAGNDSDDSDKQGGILLESRAETQIFNFKNKVGEEVESAGIMFKTKKAPIVAWSKDIYLRTGGGDVESGGNLILDADKGKSRILTHSSEMHHFLTTAYSMAFGKEGEFEQVNSFSKGTTVLGTPICMKGQLTIADGGITVDNGIQIANGHISSSQSAASDGKVGELKSQPLSLAKQAVRECRTLATDTLIASEKLAYTTLDEDYYKEEKPGDDDVIEQAGFSFRKQSQYKTEDWKLFEDRWQNIARLGMSSLPKWKERSVKAGSEQTYPYPGKEKTKESAEFYTQDLKGFDISQGNAKDRDDSFYEMPEYEEPQQKTLNDEYMIIIDE